MRKNHGKVKTINTKQDLSALDYAHLRALRKKADEFGLRDFRGVVDAEMSRRKQATGALGERDSLYFKLLGGELPLGGIPKEQRCTWSPKQESNRLVVEIPESELAPSIGTLYAWVWERTAPQARRERAELRATRDSNAQQAAAERLHCLLDARVGGAEVVPILYRPVKGGGKNYREVRLRGKAVVADAATGAFRVEFYTTKEEGEPK